MERIKGLGVASGRLVEGRLTAELLQVGMPPLQP